MNHKITPHGRPQKNKDEGRTNPCKEKGAGPSGSYENITPCPSSGLRSCSCKSWTPGSPHRAWGEKLSQVSQIYWCEFLMSGSSEELISLLRPHPPPTKGQSAVWPERGGFPLLPQDAALGHTWADNNRKGRTETNYSHENPGSGAPPHHSMRPTLLYSLQLNSANMWSNPFHGWGTEARARRWWSQELNPSVSDVKSPYRQKLYLKLMASLLY